MVLQAYAHKAVSDQSILLTVRACHAGVSVTALPILDTYRLISTTTVPVPREKLLIASQRNLIQEQFATAVAAWLAERLL
jgi:hypothetical protein